MGREAPGDLPGLAKEYLLEEQKQRRAEIESLIARIERDQRFALIITGLYWSWLVTQGEHISNINEFLIVLLPITIMAIFAFKWYAHDNTIESTAVYTRQLEEQFRLPPRIGWERWLLGKSPGGSAKQRFRGFNRTFWMLLIAGNLVLAFFFHVGRSKPTGPP